MAQTRSRSPCQQCQQQLVQEMMMIPARYLTEEVRVKLSKVLDPPRVIYGSDYKTFADKNGLTPDTVEWLDSQKTQFNTSSIKAVLKYLIEKKGDSFTIYQVYRTLYQMNSSGQCVIIDGMPGIRRLYRQESRPGEEHSEPPSVNIAPQAYPSHQRFGDSPAQFIQRARSPPPSYNNAVYPQSIHMEGGDAALALNDLNAGKQVTASSAASHQSSLPQTARSAERDRAFSPEPSDSNHQHYRHAPCENSGHHSGFPGSPHARGDCPAGGRQAEERSFCSDSTNESNISPGTLPSYADSQRLHGRTYNQCRMSPQSPTEMHELKLPLEGPEVSPGGFSGSIPTGSSVSGRGQDSSTSALPCNRPTSFPTSRPPSYKLGHEAARPVSESQFCSHLGACNCSASQPTFVPPSLLSLHSSDSLPSCGSYISDLDIPESDSGVSAVGAPWDECRHQTEVKQPLRGPRDTNAALQQWSMPQHSGVNRPSPCRQLSLRVASSAQNGFLVLPNLAVLEPKEKHTSTHFRTKRAFVQFKVLRLIVTMKLVFNMKQNDKLRTVFRCLFFRKTRDRTQDSEEKMMLLPSPSVDSISRLCDETAGGFSNDSSCCGGVGGDQERSRASDCVVTCSSAAELSVLPDYWSLSVVSTPQHQMYPCLTSRFVLVVAADMDETVCLDQQVGLLCQQLSMHGINYVVVRSTSLWPVVGLSRKLQDKLPTLQDDFKSVQNFVWGCFKRASKVLMVITPGYLRYADAFCENPGKVETYQQKLIRKIQEKLKAEFFEQKRAFRIWPVLLQEMKANRVHVPSFLSSSAHYWFPYMHGAEDVMAILREDLNTRSSNVKRSI